MNQSDWNKQFTDGKPELKLDFRPLSEDERELIQDMMETQGWKLLNDKIFARQEYYLARMCTVPNKENIDYAQGMYAGFRYCRSVVEQAATKEKAKSAGRKR